MHSNKKDKIKSFDPSSVVNSDNIFGLPFNVSEAKVVILPVPWDITASNRMGASNAPAGILKSSSQINLYNSICPDAWKAGIVMEKIPEHVIELNKKIASKTNIYRQFLQNGGVLEKSPEMLAIRDEVNKASAEVSAEVQKNSKKILSEGKYPALLGGDHSTPLGLIRALAKKHNDFGILQIDAHNDLHNCYEGFEQSHASIIHNVLPLKEVEKIVQVGVREMSHEENQVIKDNPDRIKLFHNSEMKEQIFNGNTWDSICENIISELPQKVYITFDIDGLEPANCPSTGTPAPGGIAYDGAMYLLDKLVKRNRVLIGFDLVEVVPGITEIDTITGANVLFKLSAILIKTNNLI